ncbi:hypothetical protein F7725_020660, partial [Dissostichus mawsoni]
MNVNIIIPAGIKGDPVKCQRVSWLEWQPCLLLAYATGTSQGWVQRSMYQGEEARLRSGSQAGARERKHLALCINNQ